MHRHFDDVLLGSIELFCLAAEAGSFTAAANTAGVTPAAVSRSISRLEKRLGVRLFVRSTRSIRLTEGGRSYFEQCRGALNQLIEAERKVTGEQVQPSGTLRISAPTTYGHYRLLPLLPAARAVSSPQVRGPDRQPQYRFPRGELRCGDPVPRAAGFDDGLAPSGGCGTGGGGEPWVSEAGRTAAGPGGLQQHECIQFDLPSSGRPIAWLFMDGGREREVLATESHYLCAEDVLAGVTWPGPAPVCSKPTAFERDLADGTLVEVLQPFAGRSRPVSLMYPHGRLLPCGSGCSWIF
jgi:DNA-binding transcriptional LysR family regulator